MHPAWLMVIAMAAAPAPGDRIPVLAFQDTRFLNRTVDDLKAEKATVVVFLDTGCPLVARYVPTLKRLEAEYRAKGVRFVGLFPNAEESVTAIAAWAVKAGLEFPVGRDVDATAAKAVGATVTPEAVVLGPGKKLAYRGRIDDQYRPGGTLPKPTRQDLREAIEAVIAGRAVEPAAIPADGCPITPPEPVKGDSSLNFAEHVAPILRKHCVECHRPNTVAPFPLVEYEHVWPRARAIAAVVRSGQMPPWYGAPQHTDFINRRGLSATERETLLAWLASDRAKGDPAKLPPPPAPADEWRIGKPDLIIAAPRHEIPEAGDVPYKYAILPHIFLHDTWVEAVEIKPDNPRVLHHCNLAYVQLGQKFSIDNFITGAVPGGDAMTMPAGVAQRIPAGAGLVCQIHYVSTGQKEECTIRVGIRFCRQPVEKRLRLSYVATTQYEIPPGAPAHRVSATRTLPCDAIVVGLFSHMHVRGRDMAFLAHTPDGKTETMLLVPNYSFDWQHAYRWEYGKKTLPKGTRLECVAHYDNSEFNPFNPDPAATVRDGDQTHQEMLNGFVFYVDAHERLGLSVDPSTGRPR
jgi:thiol-disulfide isomerase/thioredoxin/mono/diheme cytochrome c family protein